MWKIALKGEVCPIRLAKVLQSRIFDAFNKARSLIYDNLKALCELISLSLDAWTSKNHHAIFGVIGHWITKDFEYQEVVLDFGHLKGKHSRENLATYTFLLFNTLDLKQKLFLITRDNASNNSTLCCHLYKKLQKEFDDVERPT